MYYDLVVIGGGPAGLAAAIEAKKHIKSVLLIERDIELGGILNQCIHNGFGLHYFDEELTGPEYGQRFIDEFYKSKIDFKLNTTVINIDKEKKVKIVNSEGVNIIKAKSIILSMGCRERARGAIHIPGSRPSGIFTAGNAQRYINIEGYMVGKRVVILGSGDIGLIMARRLTLEGAEVLAVLEINSYSSGLNRNIVQCLDDYNIPIKYNHTIIDIKGTDRLESITAVEVDENNQIIENTEKEYICDTLLLSVGLIPENELSKQIGVKLNKITKGPIVNESLETNIEGVFACGNVLHVHDLVDFVTEEAILAAKSSVDYIKSKKEIFSKEVEIEIGSNISYIIPNKIRVKYLKDELKLLFRVKSKMINKTIVIKDGEKIIQKLKKTYLSPGEMENIVIKKENSDKISSLQISIQE